MKPFYFRLLGVITIFFNAGCGDTSIKVGPNSYEPKIVIDGYIYPGNIVQDIRIMRNNPINGTLSDDIALDSALVTITDLQTSMVYPLIFDKNGKAYRYDSTDLVIGYNKRYRLDVQAEIDGKVLNASSITTMPDSGFQILETESIIDSLTYRQRNTLGRLENFLLRFQRSPNTSFYAISITSLDADTSTFIYYPANPAGNIDRNEVLRTFEYYRHIMIYVNNTPISAGISERSIDWADIWFYGRYQIIVYAADRNYRDFCLSFDNVEEQDGNYHEPAMHIQGDGIGVFGSMIADTVFVKVLR